MKRTRAISRIFQGLVLHLETIIHAEFKNFASESCTVQLSDVQYLHNITLVTIFLLLLSSVKFTGFYGIDKKCFSW